MCPPDYYGIEYEINPWMHRKNQPIQELAAQQWKALVEILWQMGAVVESVEPVRGLPDLVFTANAGVVLGNRVVLSRFRHAARQGEEPVFAQWFATHGFQVTRLADEQYFEGAGDALFCGDTLFAGYRHRSDIRALQEVAALLGHRIVPMELVDPYFYHVDTCLCPLAPGVAAYFPGAFDQYGQRSLREWIPDLIEVASDEARHFACNAVVVGRHVVTNVGCPEFHRQLRERGFEPVATDLGEFLKSGGSAKCLTLRLDGEEAAPKVDASR